MDSNKVDAIEVAISYRDLTVEHSELYSYMGYRGSQPNDDVLSIIGELEEELKTLCKPRFGYRIVEGRVVKPKLFLEDQEFSPDVIIAHQLRGNSKYAILIGTVGTEMDEWIHSYRVDADIMKAFVADAFGSVVAEAIVTYGAKYLTDLAAKDGEGVTNSYSPGYCGWHVSEQHMLFSLLPERFCGVTLTDSSLMLPIKSVSSVVGIGETAIYRNYGCAICNKKDCYKRSLPSGS